MRPDQQLDQARVGFGDGRRTGAVDQHPDLPPGAAKPYRHGQGLGFVVRRARGWCRGAIEERGKLCRASADVDLVGSDVDALDQDGNQRTLACSWQLGPDLADFRGSCDDAALR